MTVFVYFLFKWKMALNSSFKSRWEVLFKKCIYSPGNEKDLLFLLILHLNCNGLTLKPMASFPTSATCKKKRRMSKI